MVRDEDMEVFSFAVIKRLACSLCSFVGRHHVSSVYKLAVSARVCNQQRERERESSRVESLSHMAFLPVFRLLSGSSVVPSKIKQTLKKKKKALLPPTSTRLRTHKERELEREGRE